MKKFLENFTDSYSGLNQGALIIRLLGGGYVFYIGIKLLRSASEENPNILVTLIIPILFLLFGGFFFLAVCYELLRRHYQTLADASRSAVEDGGEPLSFKGYEKKIMQLLHIDFE